MSEVWARFLFLAMPRRVEYFQREALSGPGGFEQDFCFWQCQEGLNAFKGRQVGGIANSMSLAMSKMVEYSQKEALSGLGGFGQVFDSGNVKKG